MRVLSVNVGEPRDLEVKGRLVSTGIFKVPVRGSRRIEKEGIAGDVRVEPRKLGELHHAVYAYPYEHYGFWHRYLGAGAGAFALGQFGENLTITGPVESQVRLGDVLRVGTATLQVSQPRIPCSKLSARMGGSFAGTFLRSRRTGYLLRVLDGGEVEAGTTIEVIQSDTSSPTMDELVRISQLDYGDAEGLSSLLGATTLMPGWRELIEEKLARARAARGGLGLTELEVVGREQEHDVVSYRLRSALGRPLPPFRAGQHLLVDPGLSADAPASRRVGWLSGSPFDRDTYRITTLAAPGPDAPACRAERSLLLPADLEVGARVRATAPRGELTLDGVARDGEGLLFLCEGLGIAPVVSLLHEWRELFAAVPARLVHLDRRAHPLRHAVEQIGASHPPLDVRWFDGDRIPGGAEGLAALLPGATGPLLVAGGCGFVDELTTQLRALGVEPSRVRVARLPG